MPGHAYGATMERIATWLAVSSTLDGKIRECEATAPFISRVSRSFSWFRHSRVFPRVPTKPQAAQAMERKYYVTKSLTMANFLDFGGQT